VTEEFDERDLDALGDLIDEMFVENKHPREIMTVLMEHESQWNDIMLRTLRYGRIYQLDFICKCTDAQIRVIARHVQSHTVVTDLCVWQVLQSGLPAYIKNLFRRGGAVESSRNHPWHNGMSDELDDFETHMSMCPPRYNLSPGNLTVDFLKTTLWLSRIFQDDVFFSQDTEVCRAMLDSVYAFPDEIEIPFMAQLLERGKPQLKALVWSRMAGRRVDQSCGALWNPSRDNNYDGLMEIRAEHFVCFPKYRRLFYGCAWVDNIICNKELNGHEFVSCRMPSEHDSIVSFSQKPQFDPRCRRRIEEMMKCTSYDEFELKRSIGGVRLTKRLVQRLIGDARYITDCEPRCAILSGLVENHLQELEKHISLERMTLKLIWRSTCEEELDEFLWAVERVRPGMIAKFRDGYGGTMLNYLPRGPFTLKPIPFDDDQKRYEVLVSLGCDPEIASPNGCSIAELLRFLGVQYGDCFDFAQAVKL